MTTTFAASLELAKQGQLVLAQDGLFLPIQVSRPLATAPIGGDFADVELGDIPFDH